MTITKTSAEPTSECEASVSSIALLTDDSDAGPAADRRADDSNFTPHASSSLGQLEQDLVQLQSKWQAVEQDMHDRDHAIAMLGQNIVDYQQTITALEAELTEVKSNNVLLNESLARAQSSIATLEIETNDHKRELRTRDDALAAAHTDHVALQRQFGQLQDEFDCHKSDVAKSNGSADELKSKNTELRMSIQEMQDYIDGRKSDWINLKKQVKDYQDTIEGMSDSLEFHDRIVAEKEQEKADLALKVMELERCLAELKGRYSEKESSHAELQQTSEKQSHDLSRLRSKNMKLRKDSERLRKELERTEATVASLKTEFNDRDRDSNSPGMLAADENAIVADMHKKLDAAKHRIAELETEQKQKTVAAETMATTIEQLRARLHQAETTSAKQEPKITDRQDSLHINRATEDALRSEIARSATRLDEISTRAAESERHAAQLEALLLEARSEQNDMQEELEAHRELVRVLESEISNKQEDLNSLDRNYICLAELGTGIFELDRRIEEPQHQPQDDRPVHWIVVENRGSSAIARYPIDTKELTIGRSSKNDILLKDKYISRVHARIKVRGPEVIIEDAGSMNGFRVNDVHTTRHTLKDGDRVEIGLDKLTYLDQSYG